MRVRYLMPFVAAGAALLAMTPVLATPGHQPQPAHRPHAPHPRPTHYPPHRPALTVSPATLVGCGSVTVHGTGYEGNEDVRITVATTPRAGAFSPEGGGENTVTLKPVARAVSMQAEQVVHADSDGQFSATVRISEVGLATITATGMTSNRSASVVVTVVPPACGMPPTGNSSGSLLWLGTTALSSGVLLLLSGTLLWRRRHR